MGDDAHSQQVDNKFYNFHDSNDLCNLISYMYVLNVTYICNFDHVNNSNTFDTVEDLTKFYEGADTLQALNPWQQVVQSDIQP